MVAPERSRLRGFVEVDDTYIGGVDSGRRGGRDSLGMASIVVVAIEVRESGLGRLRMEAVDDVSADSLCGFVEDNVERGATVRTDAWQGYKRLGRIGYDHQSFNQRAAFDAGGGETDAVPKAHRIIGNLKAWLSGTYKGVSDQQLQAYLDEFVFRFNRRRTPMAAFQTLLGIGSNRPPSTYEQIRAGAWLG